MRNIKWLAALAVLSLLVAPALSVPAGKGCACTLGGCSSGGSGDGSHAMRCGGNCSNDSYAPHGNACSCQILPSTNIVAYDSGYSYIHRGSNRSYDRESRFASSSCPHTGSTRPDPDPSPENFEGIGPPDLEVVEFLPPSAKLIFSVLASDGPLTQKDLISKTDLPPRTVRYALGRLKDECVIKEGFNFRDARQSMYGLNTEAFKAARM